MHWTPPARRALAGWPRGCGRLRRCLTTTQRRWVLRGAKSMADLRQCHPAGRLDGRIPRPAVLLAAAPALCARLGCPTAGSRQWNRTAEPVARQPQRPAQLRLPVVAGRLPWGRGDGSHPTSKRAIRAAAAQAAAAKPTAVVATTAAALMMPATGADPPISSMSSASAATTMPPAPPQPRSDLEATATAAGPRATAMSRCRCATPSATRPQQSLASCGAARWTSTAAASCSGARQTWCRAGWRPAGRRPRPRWAQGWCASCGRGRSCCAGRWAAGGAAAGALAPAAARHEPVRVGSSTQLVRQRQRAAVARLLLRRHMQTGRVQVRQLAAHPAAAARTSPCAAGPTPPSRVEIKDAADSRIPPIPMTLNDLGRPAAPDWLPPVCANLALDARPRTTFAPDDKMPAGRGGRAALSDAH